MKRRKITNSRLDNLWRACVKHIADYKCEKCMKNYGCFHCHHIFGKKGHPSTKWDIENGICLCVNCHVWKSGSAHETSTEFTKWIISKRGQEWYARLLVKAKKAGKVDREEKLRVLKQVIAERNIKL